MSSFRRANGALPVNLGSGWYKSVVLRATQLSVIAIAILMWEFILASGAGEFWVGKPSKVYFVLKEWTENGELLWHLSATISAALLGYVIGVMASATCAFTAGMCPLADKISIPYVTAGYSFPKEAIAPLFIIIFGIGIGSKVALASVAVFFIVYQSTLTGVRDVDRDFINVMKVSGANTWHLFTLVLAPAAAAWIFMSMRLSIRHALTSVIFAEMLSGNRGLGYLIKYSANQFDATGVFAALMIAMIVGVVVTTGLERIERFAIRWRV